MGHSASLKRCLLASVAAVGALWMGTGHALAVYVQTNLVSDIPGLATILDPLLVNPWGMSASPTSPFWTSNQATSTATLYSVAGETGVAKVLVAPNGFVAIPTTAAPQGPTGQVNNTNTSTFLVHNGGNGQSAHFIFANLNGSISAWDTGATSFVQRTTSGAIYTGLAINSAGTVLYAANSAGTGGVNAFNSSFNPTSLTGTFTGPAHPGLVPFNVQDIGGKVYVTYAPAGGRANQIHVAEGNGIVDVFDEQGNFLQRLINGSHLASPWGVALAPSTFGQFGGDLLVGNFSFDASEINAFDPTTGAFEGTVMKFDGTDAALNGNSPGGLWGFMFGSGAAAGGDPNTLYFNDGINGETDGLFGALTVPEPSSMALLGISAALVGVRRVRSRRRA